MSVKCTIYVYCFILMACSIARWQEQHYTSIEYVEWCNYNTNKHLIVVCNCICENSGKDQRCRSGIRRYHYSIRLLPVGVVMCDRPASRIFGPLRCFTLTRKASTMSNSANIVLHLWIQRRRCYESDRGITIATVALQKWSTSVRIMWV